MSEHRPKIHISEKEQAIIKMEKIVLCLKLEKENIIFKKKPYMFHFILYTKYIPRRTVLKLSFDDESEEGRCIRVNLNRIFQKLSGLTGCLMFY